MINKKLKADIENDPHSCSVINPGTVTLKIKSYYEINEWDTNVNLIDDETFDWSSDEMGLGYEYTICQTGLDTPMKSLKYPVENCIDYGDTFSASIKLAKECFCDEETILSRGETGCTWWAKIAYTIFNGKICEWVSRETDGNLPGCGHPDDFEGVVTSGGNTYTVENYSEDSNIAILMNGFVPGTFRLLEKYGYDAKVIIPEELGDDSFDDIELLIIPSGGFYGLENLQILKNGIESFVFRGGRVLCFTQQHGYEWGVLPTSYDDSIDGYGWVQDQECYREV